VRRGDNAVGQTSILCRGQFSSVAGILFSHSGGGRVGAHARRRGRVSGQAVRAVHARLHGHQLRAEHRLLLLLRSHGGDTLLPLPPGLDQLPLRRLRRPRRNTRVRVTTFYKKSQSNLGRAASPPLTHRIPTFTTKTAPSASTISTQSNTLIAFCHNSHVRIDTGGRHFGNISALLAILIESDATHYPKRHSDLLNRFATVHATDRPTDRQTDRQTDTGDWRQVCTNSRLRSILSDAANNVINKIVKDA